MTLAGGWDHSMLIFDFPILNFKPGADRDETLRRSTSVEAQPAVVSLRHADAVVLGKPELYSA